MVMNYIQSRDSALSRDAREERTHTRRPWEKATKDASIDTLGKVRYQIKKLEEREKELVASIRAMGEGTHEGFIYKAMVDVSERTSLDTKAATAILGDIAPMKTTQVVTVRVTQK